MNGIKMSDCKFYVDEAARTIVCVIPEKINTNQTRNMVIDFARDNFGFTDFNIEYGINFNLMDKIKMPRTFIGKAVCAPGDEWNEELGRKIAFSRAKDKCYKSFFKRANVLVQTIDRRLGDMIARFNDFGLKLEAKRESLQSSIDSQMNNE